MHRVGHGPDSGQASTSSLAEPQTQPRILCNCSRIVNVARLHAARLPNETSA